ncbi:MAG: hypothetical protein NT159_19250 [Proteobacteria bacterium]|nr:hypothetical protein [Pseudomonadota bacterium]
MSQLITWLLIVAGWVIVHYLTLTRERQKEIRDLKSKIVEHILEIEKRSIAFHQSPNHRPDEARNLVAEIDRVITTIARQPLSLLCISPLVLRQFRSGITLKNFDPSRFQAQPSTSRLLSDISLHTEALINALEQAYAGRYLNKWWQVFRV